MNSLLVRPIAASLIGSEQADGTTALTVSQALMCILIGVVVVFSVLIALTLIFKLFGLLVDAGTHSKGKKKAKKEDEKAASSAPAASSASSASAPQVEAGISGEVVAAISAAIACLSAGSGRSLAVRRISRAQSGRAVAGRAAWGAAGVADNTRPF